MTSRLSGTRWWRLGPPHTHRPPPSVTSTPHAQLQSNYGPGLSGERLPARPPARPLQPLRLLHILYRAHLPACKQPPSWSPASCHSFPPRRGRAHSAHRPSSPFHPQAPPPGPSKAGSPSTCPRQASWVSAQPLVRRPGFLRARGWHSREPASPVPSQAHRPPPGPPWVLSTSSSLGLRSPQTRCSALRAAETATPGGQGRTGHLGGAGGTV